MPDRNRYFVSPEGDDWKVTKEGGTVIRQAPAEDGGRKGGHR